MHNDNNGQSSIFKVKIFMNNKLFWHELDFKNILTVSFTNKPDEQDHHYSEDQNNQRDDEAH